MPTEHERAVQSLLEVMPLAMRTLGMEMRQLGDNLPPSYFRLLQLLSQRPYYLTELAGHQGVSAPTMSNSVKTLVERGWVERVRDPEDQRRVLVEISPAGHAMLSSIHKRLSARVGELCAPLSSAECEELLQGLAIIERVFAQNEGNDDDI